MSRVQVSAPLSCAHRCARAGGRPLGPPWRHLALGSRRTREGEGRLMARIRSLKPDAFKSESLSRVPRGTRWTFAGLWTYLDDAGRGKDNARLIWAELYPLDEDVTVED